MPSKVLYKIELLKRIIRKRGGGRYIDREPKNEQKYFVKKSTHADYNHPLPFNSVILKPVQYWYKKVKVH